MIVSDWLGKMLLNAFLQPLGCTSYIPTIAVAHKLIDNKVAHKQIGGDGQVIHSSWSQEERPGCKNNLCFNSKVAMLNGCSNLLFKFGWNIYWPWKMEINQAFLGSMLRWLVELSDLLGKCGCNNMVIIIIIIWYPLATKIDWIFLSSAWNLLYIIIFFNRNSSSVKANIDKTWQKNLPY